jgi:hypothetical protein
MTNNSDTIIIGAGRKVLTPGPLATLAPGAHLSWRTVPGSAGEYRGGAPKWRVRAPRVTKQAEDFPPPVFRLSFYNSLVLLAILSFARATNSLNGMLFC